MRSAPVLASVLACAVVLGFPIAAPRPALAQAARPAPPPCTPGPVGDLNFVCGVVAMEDLLPVGGGRWLVGGSYKAGSAGLYLIDTAAKTAQPVNLSIAAKPDPIYQGCPAPDLKGLSTHGLDVRPGRGGTVTVYTVNHGGRESVEVWRLDAAKNAAEWVGCVMAPAGADTNSVVGLGGGRFAVTRFMDKSKNQAFADIMKKTVTGAVFVWTPGKGFAELAGSQFSGDNGIAASPDGKWLYVNAYGSNEIWRIPVSGQDERTSAKVDFYPDNLRWSPDGKLFVTGQFLNPTSFAGRHGWATVKLDPRTMAVTPVVKEPGLPEFDDATSTVQTGNTLWFGSFRGDRIAYRTAP